MHDPAQVGESWRVGEQRTLTGEVCVLGFRKRTRYRERRGLSIWTRRACHRRNPIDPARIDDDLRPAGGDRAAISGADEVCPRQDSNLGKTRFRKPPLYPPELRGPTTEI